MKTIEEKAIETACKCVCHNCKDASGCDGNSPYTCPIIQSIEKLMNDDFSKVSENNTKTDDFAEFTKLFIDRTCDILSNTLPLYFDCATNEPPFWKQIKRDDYINLVRETLENI